MIMSGFMAALGHLEVRAEQEGLKLVHAAGEWVDHLSWDQVKHLLLPAIRDVAPGVLAELGGTSASSAPEPPADGTAEDIPAHVQELLGEWFDGAADKLRAEIGKELDKVHARIDALGGDQGGDGTVTTQAADSAPAKKAAARKAVARKPVATPAGASK